MIKTFRGIIDDTQQNRIRLSTIKGKVGYRIIKFKCIQTTFGNSEMILKIFKQEQTTVTAPIDFTDSDLLGAAMVSGANASESAPEDVTVVFDREIFNQDIYITGAAVSSGQNTNYYLELEVIPLDDAGAEYTTLKDMRQPG